MRADRVHVKVPIPTADLLAKMARQHNITIGDAVDIVCAAEIESAPAHKTEQLGSVAREMFRIARPEVRP